MLLLFAFKIFQAIAADMGLIQTGEVWQFRTEADLEELAWHHLPELLKLKPLSRQFSIGGKFCDILAVEPSQRLVVIELKNIEDRYVVQQLTRYYDAIQTAKPLLAGVDYAKPIRLMAIAPSFHADTLADCKYSTLAIELFTFSIQESSKGLSLSIRDAAGEKISHLPLQKALYSAQSDIEVAAPPRKLLNWLSHHDALEYDWILQLRQQLLSFDSRMKEIVEPTRILYGKGKSKPCCELKKIRETEHRGKGIDCCLWLPDPENKPHVIKMWVSFDLEKRQVPLMMYGRKGYRSGSPWRFPKCVKWMKSFGYQRSLALYQPFLNANMTISPTNMVNLALQTWLHRI